ncbi:hypothetical protein [Halosimplex carlsbadense]|uniref:hypothetical protein n=1 Tax=Halosimplex carlsbadense TaxID=171164 RepID=UPI001377E2ED|nr:hypothetical protein [Halosimplex carlsbadense]
MSFVRGDASDAAGGDGDARRRAVRTFVAALAFVWAVALGVVVRHVAWPRLAAKAG